MLSARSVTTLALGAALVLPQSAHAGKGSKKGSRGSQYALVAHMAPYPGYSGSLSPDGSATIRFNEDDGMLISLNVEGLEDDATAGVHIHAGTSCSTGTGGHYWDEATLGTGSVNDPWNLYNSGSGTQYETQGTVTDYVIGNINNGYGYDDNVGRTLVMHDSGGTRVACGVLVREFESLTADIGAYPGYSGPMNVDGKVTVDFLPGRTFDFSYNLKGVESDATGGVHIHTGVTCSDASLVGGHWWADDRVDDLWTTAAGAVYMSDSRGNAKGSYYLGTGHDVGAFNSRAIVVHNANGDRVGCGVLSPSGKRGKQGKRSRLSSEQASGLSQQGTVMFASVGAVVGVAVLAMFAVRRVKARVATKGFEYAELNEATNLVASDSI